MGPNRGVLGLPALIDGINYRLDNADINQRLRLIIGNAAEYTIESLIRCENNPKAWVHNEYLMIKVKREEVYDFLLGFRP